MRDRITLECTQCKNRNYTTTKNKRNTSERLELKNIANSAKLILSIRKLNRWKCKDVSLWQLEPQLRAMENWKGILKV